MYVCNIYIYTYTYIHICNIYIHIQCGTTTQMEISITFLVTWATNQNPETTDHICDLQVMKRSQKHQKFGHQTERTRQLQGAHKSFGSFNLPQKAWTSSGPRNSWNDLGFGSNLRYDRWSTNFRIWSIYKSSVVGVSIIWSKPISTPSLIWTKPSFDRLKKEWSCIRHADIMPDDHLIFKYPRYRSGWSSHKFLNAVTFSVPGPQHPFVHGLSLMCCSSRPHKWDTTVDTTADRGRWPWVCLFMGPPKSSGCSWWSWWLTSGIGIGVVYRYTLLRLDKLMNPNRSCFVHSWSGWWFQPLWKIWKSVGIIIPNMEK